VFDFHAIIIDKQTHLITMFNWLNVVVSVRAQKVVRTLLKIGI